jgi:hypothetical protein
VQLFLHRLNANVEWKMKNETVRTIVEAEHLLAWGPQGRAFLISRE